MTEAEEGEAAALHACRSLVAAVALHADRRDGEAVAALFSPDGAWTRGGGTLTGRAKIAESYRKLAAASPHARTRHIAGAGVFKLEDEGRASSITPYLMIRHDSGVVAEPPLPLAGVSSAGEWRDQFQRTDEGWRILRRETFREFQAPTPASSIGAGPPPSPSDLYETGLATRRAVLGDAYVDRALAASDAFDAAFQALVTEYAWGAVWSRPGLDRRTRSLLNIAMLTVLNRPAELRLHTRAALRNGVDAPAISEVLLQTAIYGGVPAALEAYKLAREVLQEDGGL